MLRSYHVSPEDLEDKNWQALYEVRRRDALFAFSIPESQGSVILGRDHLGAVPLFYRVRNGVVESSVLLEELIHGDETVDEAGLTAFIALGTAKLLSPFTEITAVEPGTVIRVHPKGEVEVLYRYRFTAAQTSFVSPRANAKEVDRLLRQAARRTLESAERVGLYLSGGVDSGLTGHYLKTQGASVHAYTTTPWGSGSAEGKLAAQNAAAIEAAHTIVPFETTSYVEYVTQATKAVGTPVGAASVMAIACMTKHTDVLKESHVYFAQNADTATASVADQSLTYFAHCLPAFVRRALHRLFTSHSPVENFVALRTTGLLRRIPFLQSLDSYPTLQALTLAGMLLAHTPVDGDIVIEFSLKRGQRVSNLFYDVDVIEYLMGIPLWQRLALSGDWRRPLMIRKNVLRTLARPILPKAVIERKKGLSVPVHTDHHARAFFDSLPTQIGARTLTLPQHRFAAHILKRWAENLTKSPVSITLLFHD